MVRIVEDNWGGWVWLTLGGLVSLPATALWGKGAVCENADGLGSGEVAHPLVEKPARRASKNRRFRLETRLSVD